MIWSFLFFLRNPRTGIRRFIAETRWGNQLTHKDDCLIDEMTCGELLRASLLPYSSHTC